MASVETVKQYLAYWFQLGKRVILKQSFASLLPNPVFVGGIYSPEFDECWQKIDRVEGRDCYLEGTTQTIAQLLTPMWDIVPCATCSMPVPKIELGVQPMGCPCDDLNNWPNNELPLPRKAIDTKQHLQLLRSRLRKNERSIIDN
jgi:hypothetical protein